MSLIEHRIKEFLDIKAEVHELPEKQRLFIDGVDEQLGDRRLRGPMSNFFLTF
jgi:hypothetical protein